LFSGLALAAAGSVDASPALWAGALAVLWAGSRCLPASVQPAGSPLIAGSVLGFGIWMVLTNLWANPSYTAAAPYHAAFLLCGFLIGRRAGAEAAPLLFKAALALALGLAAWTLWQRIGQGAERAQALFETPATLGATINLILLPALAVFVWGKRRVALAIGVCLLVAALVATGSRGAWLAAAAASAVAVLVAGHAGFRAPLAWLATAAAISGGLVVGALLLNVGSSTARLDLYGLALRAIAPATLATGSGYLSFYYLLESARGSGIEYGDALTTYFVHNDYLQTLLELGIPGLACLIALAVLPQAQAWRASMLTPDRRLTAVALSGGLASMAVHALVDFPFYVPVCLLLYGGAVGLLDSLQPAASDMRVPRVLVTASMALGMWVLLAPLAAQAAAGYADRQWRLARGENAAYWFEVARRIESRDWRYHWYAGQFWQAQAEANRRPEAARLADAAFAEGFAANPREVRNLLGRISTHVRLRSLLATPVDPATLRAWVDRALALAPQDPLVQAERDRVLQGLQK